MAYLVYILRCEDDTLYTGLTNDLTHRLRAHTGAVSAGARYTRSHPPRRVEAVWECGDKIAAARLEYAIKKSLCRRDKEALIAAPDILTDKLPQLAELTFRYRGDLTGEVRK